MADKLSIYQLGSPVLRQQAAPIVDVHHQGIQQLIQAMLTTLRDAKGVGIAAPQIGHSWQLLIIASHPNARYPHAPEMEPMAVINPQILAHSDDRVKDWEGCLSVPGIRGLVPRYRSIDIAFLDQWGQPQRQVFHDFVARIFQHEYDHLEGKVFLDRVEHSADLMSEAEYQRQIVDRANGANP